MLVAYWWVSVIWFAYKARMEVCKAHQKPTFSCYVLHLHIEALFIGWQLLLILELVSENKHPESAAQIEPGNCHDISGKDISLPWCHQDTLMLKNHRPLERMGTIREMDLYTGNFLSKYGKLHIKLVIVKYLLLMSDDPRKY